MHRNQISNLERNQSHGPSRPADPLLSTVYRFARALDVAPEVLLPDRDSRRGNTSIENAELSWPAVEVELVNATRPLDRSDVPPAPRDGRIKTGTVLIRSRRRRPHRARGWAVA